MILAFRVKQPSSPKHSLNPTGHTLGIGINGRVGWRSHPNRHYALLNLQIVKVAYIINILTPGGGRDRSRSPPIHTNHFPANEEDLFKAMA
jgi:hypothetical protein